MQYALLAYGQRGHSGPSAPDRERDCRGARPAVRDRLGPPARRRIGDHRAQRRRRLAAHRRTVHRDEGVSRRRDPGRGRQPRRRPGRRAGATGDENGRRDRGAADPSKRSSVALDAVFREHWGRVLATLVGILGDIELAEDAAQEAFATAAERWPRDGEPANPVGWLISTARNRAIDRIRRQRVLAEKTKLLVRDLELGSEATMHDRVNIPDERLELIFTCCHPALALETQVALDPAHPRRADHRGDRARVPGPVRDDEQAVDEGQAQDPRRRHPVRRAARPSTTGPTGGGPRRGLPRVQPGLGRRARRPRRRSDPTRPSARRAHARRGRSCSRCWP